MRISIPEKITAQIPNIEATTNEATPIYNICLGGRAVFMSL